MRGTDYQQADMYSYISPQPPVAKFLSDNAFSVYVFHPVFVIAGARAMHGIIWRPLVKFMV
jgi:hypothetical protein